MKSSISTNKNLVKMQLKITTELIQLIDENFLFLDVLYSKRGNKPRGYVVIKTRILKQGSKQC